MGGWGVVNGRWQKLCFVTRKTFARSPKVADLLRPPVHCADSPTSHVWCCIKMTPFLDVSARPMSAKNTQSDAGALILG